MSMSEIDYVESLIIDDGLPEWIDEDAHLHDYDYDEEEARIQEYLCEEAYLKCLIKGEPIEEDEEC